VYFIACGQWGPYPATGGEIRQTFGNSLVCDPWGQVIGRASNTVGFFTSHLDIDRVRAVRKLIPMDAHRIDFADVNVRVAAP
jgi:deaminated glutathione amidase